MPFTAMGEGSMLGWWRTRLGPGRRFPGRSSQKAAPPLVGAEPGGCDCAGNAAAASQSLTLWFSWKAPQNEEAVSGASTTKHPHRLGESCPEEERVRRAFACLQR